MSSMQRAERGRVGKLAHSVGDAVPRGLAVLIVPCGQLIGVRAFDDQIDQTGSRDSEAMGLTVSDAFRLRMIKIAKAKALPFDSLVSNEETIETIKAASV
jgi:antitoxin component of RelBE/YafQ-DinJ toxin-antitoxin module